MHGAVERGQGNISPHAQALLAFGAVGIDFVDDVGQTALLGQGFGESEVKDFGVLRRRATALDRVEDIVGFAEVRVHRDLLVL